MPDETSQSAPEPQEDSAPAANSSSGKGKNGQLIKLAVISAIVILLTFGPAFMMWGLALWAMGNSIGEPSGAYNSVSGECYMPDQYWTDPSAELTVAIIKQRVESYRNVSNAERDQNLEKLLTRTRAAGYNPVVTLAIWGKESTYSSKAQGGHDFGYLLDGWGGFDKQLEGAISTLDKAYKGEGSYPKKPGTPIQVNWLEIYTPSNVAVNANDKKTFFTIVQQAMPNQVICAASSGGLASGLGYNNVPLFRQCDARWEAHPYPKPDGTRKTVCSSGCGPTAAAMVLKFYGKNVDPVIAADFCRNNGYRANTGTSTGCFSKLASAYGLKHERLESWSSAAAVLRQGKPLIISVGPSRFASGGHFITLTGVSGNTVYINDPGPRKIKSGTISEITSAFKHGYYYIHP